MRKQVEPIVILMAEDDPEDRLLVEDALEESRVVNDLYHVSNGEELLDYLHRRNDYEDSSEAPRPDLILLDLNMPGMHGLNGLITLRNEAPTIPVVIVSAEEDKQVVLQAITYGACGFITKSSPRAQMTEAIQQILNGNVYLPSDIIRTGKESNTRRSRNEDNPISPELLNSLTRRQLLVLERMSKGESNKQIAYNLNIAETTVKAHVSAILRKLGVHNRVQAILSASDVDFSQYLKR